MKSNLIVPLEWDTNYFNIKCGKSVLTESMGEEELKIFHEEKENYDFIAIQNVGNNPHNNHVLGKNTDAYLVDINVQFAKNIEKTESGNRFSIFRAEELNEFHKNSFRIKESDFAFSKFVCDPQLKARNGYLVYQQWLLNACKDDNKYFIMYYDGDVLAAYILFRVQDATATVELVQVNDEYKGRRIATDMIHQIERYLYDKGVKKLIVGTQLNNIPAINLYHNLGFRETSRTSVYHWWK